MNARRFIRYWPKSVALVITAVCMLYAATASAVVLPWLDDPWETTDKVSGYGARSKPASCPPLPDTTVQLTVNQVVVAVLCHNPNTRADYLQLLARAADYGSNFSTYMPNVAASLGANRITSFPSATKRTTIAYSSGISASLTLFDFGQRELTIESAELGLIASGYSYDSSLQNLISNTLQAYYALLISQNSMEVAYESENFARESFEAAELRYKIGLAPLADQLQAKGSYSQTQLSVQQAKNTLVRAQAALALLMGLPPDAGITVAELDDTTLMDDPFGDTVKTLMEMAKEKRVELIASRLNLQSAEIGYQALKRRNLATVEAGVNANLDDADIFNTSTPRRNSIGVNVTIPIFTGFAQTYAESSSRRSIAAQRESLKTTELEVEQSVWTAWHDYQTAKQSWEVSWDQLASATELKDVALGRYQEGLGTILDVLSAQTQYNTALQSQLQTRLSLLTARIALIRAVGVLDLHTMQGDRVLPEPVQNKQPNGQ